MFSVTVHWCNLLFECQTKINHFLGKYHDHDTWLMSMNGWCTTRYSQHIREYIQRFYDSCNNLIKPFEKSLLRICWRFSALWFDCCRRNLRTSIFHGPFSIKLCLILRNKHIWFELIDVPVSMKCRRFCCWWWSWYLHENSSCCLNALNI